MTVMAMCVMLVIVPCVIMVMLRMIMMDMYRAVTMRIAGIGSAFRIERCFDLDNTCAEPFTMASITWSWRMRRPFPTIWVGK